tara:strand:- start:2051 stop:3424 length:1374 start_codon:yes stop_codon:yes gene_type:complete
MIKVIIFDLDGVLVNTKKIHFETLNKSLKKNKLNSISYEDHLKIYDGLPTKEKLNILSKKYRITKSIRDKIQRDKKIFTSKILKKKISYSKKIEKMFSVLSKKYKIVVATNAVKETLDICLSKLKVKKYVNFSICNEDIINPKPNPEIYFKIFIKYGIYPKECLILEDSSYGRQAALSSGGNLMPIKEEKEVTLNKITTYINTKLNKMKDTKSEQWEDNNLNILIPMAGAGKRFADVGYTFPKPLIEINNKPMIQWVVDCINIKANFIFLILKEHQEKYNISSVLKILKPNCKIIEINELTEGAACTTLLAEKFINNANPLIIANSDQFIRWNSSNVMYNLTSKKYDGAILTFRSIHPKWSYVKSDNDNIISKVAEKKVISNRATVGVYYWKKGSDYVKYANQMINQNIRVNNEFYVCPVYNEALKDKKKVKAVDVDEMIGLGTPEDLNVFIKKIDF